MKTEVLVTLLSFLTFGIKINESAESNEVLCRAVRNLRKDLVSQLRVKYPEVDPSNCAILDNCSIVECSLPIPEKTTEPLNIDLSLHWCDAQPFVQFSSNSSGFPNSNWIQKFSISNDLQSQKVLVPWNISTANLSSGEPLTLFLTVNLFPSHSQALHANERNGLFVTFEAILEMCEVVKSGGDKCNGILIHLKVSPISVSQICDDVQADMTLTPKSMKSVKPETLNMNLAGLNLYTHGHEGKKCDPNDPFSCGIGGNCRTTKTGKKGLCECFYTYEYDVNGSCVPIREPVTPPPDAASGSNSSAIWGAFWAITALILIGAFIFYGIRYNIFRRLRNRLPLYFNFCPFRRSPTVLEVHDQVSMANPLYGSDSDDPPLL